MMFCRGEVYGLLYFRGCDVVDFFSVFDVSYRGFNVGVISVWVLVRVLMLLVILGLLNVLFIGCLIVF